MTPKQLRLEALASDNWGGYEPYAVTDDGGVLCLKCLKEQAECIDTSYPGDGWYLAAIQSNSMIDASTTCDHCNKEVCPYVDN